MTPSGDQLQRAQRNAYETLANPLLKNGDKNPMYTRAKDVTIPARLQQELAWVNSTTQFVFDFSQNAPKPSATLNNRVIGITQTAVIYGIQILFGDGANANNRVYRSRGNTVNDDAVYNSTIQMKFESDTVIDFVEGQGFRDVGMSSTQAWDEMGLVLFNPQRIITGKLGTFQIMINLQNSISALAVTANMFLSVRLHCAIGQAQA